MKVRIDSGSKVKVNLEVEQGIGKKKYVLIVNFDGSEAEVVFRENLSFLSACMDRIRKLKSEQKLWRWRK